MRIQTSMVSTSLLVLAAACGGTSTPSETTASEETTETPAPQGPSIVVTPEMGHPHPGDEAPDFELTDQEGNTLRLSSLRGSVVVLAFSASWCPFSTAEQPHLAQLATDYEDQDVRVVVVNIEEDEAGFQAYMERVQMPMPVLRDATAETVSTYIPPQAQPSIERDRWKVIVSANLVIDPEGIIRHFTLVDMQNFDAELAHVRAAIDEVLSAQAGS